MAEAKLYRLIEVKRKMFLVSPTSLSILKHIEKYPEGAEYESFEKIKPAIPLNSLYVFASRLEAAKLLIRTKSTSGKPKRVRTLLKLVAPFKQHKLVIAQ